MLSVGDRLRLAGGDPLTLGPVLAKAGEGSIHQVVENPEWVAKIFHPDLRNLAEKHRKIAAMVEATPPGATQSDGFVVLTWPLDVVHDGRGPVGYVMRRVDTANAVEIHSISNPDDRNRPLPAAPQWTPKVTWMHLVNVAANLCLAVDAVHQVGAVIGDFQERNILVSDTTQVTLVDCDSMQFTGGDGSQFLCAVGRPEFTAPELAGTDLAGTPRDQPSDLFALAVHIHLLLMAGNHPFLRGRWTGAGDQPDALSLAGAGQWAGGPHSALHRHPLAPPISFLPSKIQQLFIRAFTEGATDPSRRPSAAEWRAALRAITFGTCPRGHQVPGGTPSCPWCGIDDERATRRAQRVIAGAPRPSARDAGSTTAEIASPQNTYAGVTPAPDNKRIYLTAGLVGAVIGVIIVVAVVAGRGPEKFSTDPAPSTWTPTTTTWTPTTTTWTPTTTTTTTSTIIPIPTPAAIAPGESTAAAIRNSSVGDCITRTNGAQQSDGSFDVTVSRVTCVSNSSVDQVVGRYSSIGDCGTGQWVRTTTGSSTVVLCLRRE